ncbi:carbohydrate-binding protein [Chitinibacter sp. GC72]|uniref:carbohydrate-binding protein n=1 Tax=Chitinibacter sp. GC72 TaxID=1526917 RepID=UPI0012F76AD8|nr:carbohydrate-binding protein [Chitinibacter sp. GC72]
MSTMNRWMLAAIPAAICSVQALAAPAWNNTTVYTGGEIVSYGGKDYKAQWWTQGNVPGAEQWGPWLLQTSGTATPAPTATPVVTAPPATPTPVPTASPTPTASPLSGNTCTNAAWNNNIAYTGGQKVSYDGRNYQANWWTQNNIPSSNVGSGLPWTDLGPCSGNATPTPSPTATPVGTTPTPTPTATPVGSAKFKFAPYVDVSGASDLVGWSQATGQKYISLAFYNSNGACSGTWPSDENGLLSKVQGLRALGGDVIVVTGGWNANDLARRCTTAASLAAVYQGVLDKFGADHFDLDPEAGDVYNNLEPAIVDRRNAALKILQDNFKARGKKLVTSYTIGVHPDTGLDAANLYVLQSAKAAGVEVDVVNPMVMDFYDGVSGTQMGNRSVLALQNVFNQVKTLWPGKTDAQYWAMMGATAMIGQNDTPAEIFTLNDAQILTNFAQQKGMGRLAFWSLGRDNGNCAGNSTANWQCSGIAQQNWAFSNIFGTFK